MTTYLENLFADYTHFVIICQKSTEHIFHAVGYKEPPTQESLQLLWQELETDGEFSYCAEIIKSHDYQYQILNTAEHKAILTEILTLLTG